MSALTKSAVRLGSLLALALFAAACANDAGLSEQSDGFKALSAHDYAKARDIFTALNAKDPHNPVIELNLAASYQNLGRMDLAEPVYRNVLVDGKGVSAGDTTNSKDSGKTLADIACTNLRLANSQASC